jgi:predicted nucleic acid-binding protein
VNVLVDTNVALYLLGGDSSVAEFLHERVVHVSFITELELLGYPGITEAEERAIREFLADCVSLDLSADVKRETIAIRRSTKLRLPDAIIAASAIVARMPLFSADQDMEGVEQLALLLYEP